MLLDSALDVRTQSRKQPDGTACTWKTPSAQFTLPRWTLYHASIEDEIRYFAADLLAPRAAAFGANLHFASIAKVDDTLSAVAESRDEGRGIASDVALLMNQHGDQMLALAAPDLPVLERGVASEALATLAIAATEIF